MPSEAEWRAPWDNLLEKSIRSISDRLDIQDSSYSTQRQINMPKNIAYNEAERDLQGFLTASRNFAQFDFYFSSCTDIQMTMTDTYSKPSDRADEDQVTEAASCASCKFYSILELEINQNADLKAEAKAQLRKRSAAEPHHAICGGVAPFAVPGLAISPLLNVPGGAGATTILDDLAILIPQLPTKFSKPTVVLSHEILGRAAAGDSTRFKVESSDCPVCPSVESPSMEPRSDTSTNPSVDADDNMESLFKVAIFWMEYKGLDEHASQCMHQSRFNTLAAARFFEAFGITNQPIYGLVVVKHVALITVTWCSSEVDNSVFIAERQVQSYDLCDPWSAMQFIILVFRILQETKALQERFIEIGFNDIVSVKLKAYLAALDR